jgi:hypothetical protein
MEELPAAGCCLQARRQACLVSGAVGTLLGQLQGASGPLLLSAAACLRFMALAPGAAEVLAGERGVGGWGDALSAQSCARVERSLSCTLPSLLCAFLCCSPAVARQLL